MKESHFFEWGVDLAVLGVLLTGLSYLVYYRCLQLIIAPVCDAVMPWGLPLLVGGPVMVAVGLGFVLQGGRRAVNREILSSRLSVKRFLFRGFIIFLLLTSVGSVAVYYSVRVYGSGDIPTVTLHHPCFGPCVLNFTTFMGGNVKENWEADLQEGQSVILDATLILDRPYDNGEVWISLAACTTCPGIASGSLYASSYTLPSEITFSREASVQISGTYGLTAYHGDSGIVKIELELSVK